MWCRTGAERVFLRPFHCFARVLLLLFHSGINAGKQQGRPFAIVALKMILFLKTMLKPELQQLRIHPLLRLSQHSLMVSAGNGSESGCHPGRKATIGPTVQHPTGWMPVPDLDRAPGKMSIEWLMRIHWEKRLKIKVYKI